MCGACGCESFHIINVIEDGNKTTVVYECTDCPCTWEEVEK